MDGRSLSFETQGDVLRVAGSVDEDIVAVLQERLADFVAGHRGQVVWVDVDDVDFLPSAGIGALVAAQGAALRAGGLLTLVAADGTLPARVFALMGIEHDAAVTRGTAG
ncbi:STAS domain-containing protein [Nocardioides sp. Arc9.136]|uniref:STAS domain-containing protein n=1 Tax=Nocardioides sp. Arc9.136 TaxID=2996826 RepID=UPI002665B2A7|nr:STAS domain-containing protein [Nocardioides sp. Arc9.136]WKN48125.1 STAS domain-containing protein [Nocardioides sp. Arc9.136]